MWRTTATTLLPFAVSATITPTTAFVAATILIVIAITSLTLSTRTRLIVLRRIAFAFVARFRIRLDLSILRRRIACREWRSFPLRSWCFYCRSWSHIHFGLSCSRGCGFNLSAFVSFGLRPIRSWLRDAGFSRASPRSFFRCRCIRFS